MGTIERLKELEAKATPGPWIYGHYDSHACIGQLVDGLIIWNVADSKIRCIEEADEPINFEWQRPVNTKDARLIVEIRNNISKLLAVVEAVKAMDLRCDAEELLDEPPCGDCKVCVANALMAELEVK